MSIAAQKDTGSNESVGAGILDSSDNGFVSVPQSDVKAADVSLDSGTPPSSLPDWVDDDVQSASAAYGINVKDLSRFQNKEEFFKALDAYNMQLLQQMQQIMQHQTSFPGAQQPQTPQGFGQTFAPLGAQAPVAANTAQQAQQAVSAAQQVQQQAQQQKRYLDEFLYKLSLDTSEYPEDFVQQLQGLNEHYASLMTQLAAANQALANQLGQVHAMVERAYMSQAAQEASQIWSGIKDAIHSMGDTFREHFPDFENVRQGTREYNNWMKLYETMRALHAGYAQRGVNVSDWKTLAMSALRLAFPDLVESEVRRGIVNQVQRRQGAFSARPGRNVSGGPTVSERRAIERIEQWRRDHGLEE
ncbi:MAG: hypothetical protein KatS3mg087_1135 [Patescibacteria group bacterium]|nr:MAG: hypothetical protein KatS3mg087_1135 [Patescibacteria group bacterium]